MRKMTKTAAILAAMSAMTVASASLAFAATTAERTNLSAVGKDANVDAEAVGEWKETKLGWTFTPDGESKLEKTWAQIDGVWYYFDTDGIMLQDEFISLDGETFYLNPDGSMMANGWVKFPENSEALYNYNIDPDHHTDLTQNKVTSSPYSNVWMYFDEKGHAKNDEWFQAESGLWYYFDDEVMVAGDFDHQIGSDYYGFDKNGAMLVGWAENYEDLNKTAPNKDERVWYWYDTNGKKFVANKGYDSAYGWKKIDDDWYCFYNEVKAKDFYKNATQGKDAYTGKSVGTLILNAFFTNDAAGDGNDDYYYVNKKGVMQTGVVSVDKEAIFVGTRKEGSSTKKYAWSDNVKIKNVTADGKGIEVYIDDTGKVQKDKWNNDRYYADYEATNVIIFDDAKVSNASSVSSNQYVSDEKTALITGALMKNAFVNTDDTWFYVDEDGDLIKNSAIEVGSLTGVNKVNNTVTGNYQEGTPDDRTVGTFRAYVLANRRGELYTDYKAGDKITVGSRTYIATPYYFGKDSDGSNNGNPYTNAQIFFYENEQ